jgi:hypothetical protein
LGQLVLFDELLRQAGLPRCARPWR